MTDLTTTFFASLTDPRAIPILLRSAIPVIGVFIFGWSVLETIAALFLDGLSGLWLIGATASYFGAKQFDYGETGLLNVLSFWAGVFGIFVFAAAILTFAVSVPAAMLLPIVLHADVDPWALVTSGWLPRAFALMVACQLPGLMQRVRALKASGLTPERMGLDGEMGFLLLRTITLSGSGLMLWIFGSYALHALVVVGQMIGAASEIMRDRFVADLTASLRPIPASAPSPTRRTGRKRRR